MPKREDIKLADVAIEAVRAQRKHLRDLVASRDPKSKRYKTDDMATSEQVDSAQRALAALLKEARALAKVGTDWAARTTPEEQREAVLGWFEAIPPQQQRLLIQSLTRAHNEAA